MSVSPGLYPRQAPRRTNSHAELRVYDALKCGGLPKHWTAWHSLRVRDGAGYHGEGDFVFAVPGRGMLVVEVKGGHVECQGGHWTQNGRAMDKAPLDQAMATSQRIRGRLKEMVRMAPPTAELVFFPETEFSHAPTEDVLRDAVLGAFDLKYLDEALPAHAERLWPKFAQRDAAKDGLWIGALHKMWGETWIPDLRLGDRAKLDLDRRVALDQKQLELLELVADNPRMLVRGGAGTGKTLLAAEAARRRAAMGERVLLVCFTLGLSRWLTAELEGENVEVMTIRQKAVAMLDDVGIRPDTSAPNFWGEVSLKAACDGIPPGFEPYQSVFVDEGQDLGAGDWDLVGALAGDARLWCFADEAQGFWQDRAVPEPLFQASLRLPNNYRCPGALYRVACAYAGAALDEPSLTEARHTKQLSVVVCPSESSVVGKLETEVEKLLGQGFAPGDIAILSLRGQTGEGSIFHRDKLGRHRVVHADADDMHEHIVVDTFLRFQGLERAAILITDLRLVHDKRSVRLHIALTRALTLACVVAPRDALESDRVLAHLL